jgi:hypothetical protein
MIQAIVTYYTNLLDWEQVNIGVMLIVPDWLGVMMKGRKVLLISSTILS